MKKFQFLFLSFLFLSLFVFVAGGKYQGIAQVDPSTQWEYVPNEVLVKFKEGTGRAIIQYVIEAVQGRIKTYLGREISTSE